MTSQNILSTTEGCRYCLMCRHVCPVTRVTYNEATSPHGWALAIASVQRGQLQWDAETVDLLYQCADCGLCQSFCVTDQPLPQAIVAARAEVVAAGHASAAVAAVDAALQRWGHPYGPHLLSPSPAAVGEGGTSLPSPVAMGDKRSAEGGLPGVRAETALLAGPAAWHRDRPGVQAACKLLNSTAPDHAILRVGRSSGYLAYTLGLHDTARALAHATVEEIRRVGCRTLVVLAPQQVHMLRTVYPLLGVPLPDDVEVVELTVLLATLLDEGRLKLRSTALDLVYHDPCQTPRLDGRWRAPRRLLSALTTQPLREGFWREQRAANCGASGGLPWTQPRLASDLARAALTDATASGASLVVTDAPGCLVQLRENAGPGVTVRGLYELLAESLDD
jgi:Fe-S oxidoreductase